MQYEQIILELMSRIKTLEEKVKELEEQVSLLSPTPPKDGPIASLYGSDSDEEPTTYTHITKEMLDACFSYGEKAEDASASLMGAYADRIANETGMNRNSALINLYAVRALLDGTPYKRAVSEKGVRHYLTLIRQKYGEKKLQTALLSLSAHIAYRHDIGQSVDSLVDVYRAFSAPDART